MTSCLRSPSDQGLILRTQPAWYTETALRVLPAAGSSARRHVLRQDRKMFGLHAAATNGQEPIGGWKVGLHGKRCDEPARMARPPVLLVGGHSLVAEMLTEHLHGRDRYEVESVQYCDDALAALQGRRFDLVPVLSLYVALLACEESCRRLG